ncbi:MAG: hypothetical protein AAGJ08_01850 [Cyanobacteria bacterium P01_H01_bin.35]
MQTINQVKTIAFCGDDRAKNSIYLPNTRSSSINGLPINDSAIRSMLRPYKNRSIFFFSPGFPLMGFELIDKIKKLQNVNINLRLLPYRHKPQSRGFYKREGWQELGEEDIILLFSNWEQMLNYYYQQYENMVILPLAAHYFDVMLILPRKAMNIVKQFNKVVDLEPLDEIDEENYKDGFGNLSEVGFAKIKDNIMEWIE